MADAKPRNARRLALGTAAVAVAWLFGVWPPPLWWRDHWPRDTAMMREAARGHAGSPERAGVPAIHRTPLRELSPVLQRMVIIGEDSRFHTHHGIDPAEIEDALGLDRHGGVWATVSAAWHHRDRVRGASTITQQLAKNLYLSPSRNPLRKLKEAVTALRLELALPKERILELYLNVVEWGPGIWGADAASRTYFGVAPSQLSEQQAATLAATLPQPLTSNPTFRPDRLVVRRDLILARYRGVDVYLPPAEEPDSLAAPGPPPAGPTAAAGAPLAESLKIAGPAPWQSALDTLKASRTDAPGKSTAGGPDSLRSP